MAKSKDTRDFSRAGAPTGGALDSFAAALNYRLPGAHEISVERVNPWTGTPDLLRSTKAAGSATPALLATPGEGGADDRRTAAALLVDQALEHVKAVAPALGFANAELPELVPDPNVEVLSGGAGYSVHLYQHYRGIPLFQMTRTVRFDANGAVEEVAGTTVPLLNDLPTAPSIDVRTAAMAAAEYVASTDDDDPEIDPFTQQPLVVPAVDAAEFSPTILATFPFPSQPTVLDKGPFEEPIQAYLVLFYTGPDPTGKSTRLGWHFKFSLPGYRAQYIVIVGADTQGDEREILYCQPTTFAFAAKGQKKGRKPARKGKAPAAGLENGPSAQAGSSRRATSSAATATKAPESVAKRGSAAEEALGDLVDTAAGAAPRKPAKGGPKKLRVRGNVWIHNPQMDENQRRKMIDFPRALADYLVPVSRPLPDTGFPREWCEEPTLATIGNCTVAVIGETTNSIVGRVDAEGLKFDPTDEFGDEQKVVNIFYFCNYMHDFFYLLGFDEVSGNFQLRHYTATGGTAGDPVIARAHPGVVWGTANMATRGDGVQPIMNMGAVEFRDNQGRKVVRHTALDSDVVFHEFVHGVSNRLVGGRLDAQGLQQPQSRGMGEGWSDYFALTVQSFNSPAIKEVTGDWVTGRPGGIRMHPYSSNYPATYGSVGTPPYNREHNIGEIWCATLIQMNRNLAQAFGDPKRGHLIGWQLVVDGLKFTPANPSFLDARDAILAALNAQRKSGGLNPNDYRRAWDALWKAFIRFGLGPNASSIGASLQGIREDTASPVPPVQVPDES